MKVGGKGRAWSEGIWKRGDQAGGGWPFTGTPPPVLPRVPPRRTRQPTPALRRPRPPSPAYTRRPQHPRGSRAPYAPERTGPRKPGREARIRRLPELGSGGRVAVAAGLAPQCLPCRRQGSGLAGPCPQTRHHGGPVPVPGADPPGHFRPPRPPPAASPAWLPTRRRRPVAMATW